MPLTQQQQELAGQLREFFLSDERAFILKGYAGTGKTFLIGQMGRELEAQNRTLLLMAPTGRAARVLGRKTDLQASTIHRAIYNLNELVEHDDATAAFKFYFRLKDVAADNLDVVAFVDEASMVSDQYTEGEFLRFGSGRLLADLIAFLRLRDATQKSKLVFVGDPAQLPPVSSANSPALDAAYLRDVHGLPAREYELTEVVRQSTDSAILRAATAIRQTLASPYRNCLSIVPSPPEIEMIEEPDLPARFVEVNASTRLPRTICVAYSNATCLNLNVAIRSKRFGEDGMQRPLPNDVLLVIRNSAKTGLLNGDLVSVIWADEQSETIHVRVGTETVEVTFRGMRVVAEAEDGSEIELGTKILENVLFSEKRDLSPLEQKALYVHFKMRYQKLRPNTKEFTEALRADPYFNALQVKFGYAVTCHKAQGGEWNDVFVYFEDSRTDALALRWAYTAITRARTRIFGVNLPNILPWSRVLPGRGGGRELGTPGASQSEAAKVQVTSAEPTRWDGLFPDEPSFLREQHRRMAAALASAGITIESVDVRDQNFYWRYDVLRNGVRACLRANFRRNGAITPQVVPVAGSDPALGTEALPLLRVDAITPSKAPEAGAAFPDDKPFLRAFHDDYMAPRALAAGADSVCVTHHTFLEKYHIAKGSVRTVICVHYSARGTITSMMREAGDEALCRQVIEDA